MEQFITLERAIACPRASVAVAADTAAQVLTAAGYRRGLGFGPTQSYVRSYRPTWAVTLAILLAPLAGLGLLLLLVRSKDHCNVVIEDGQYGVVALVSGRVPATLPAALEAASGAYPASAGHSGAPHSPPHMLLSPSSGGFDAPPQQPAILRPATPVPGMFTHPPQPSGHPGAPQHGGPGGGPGAEQQPYGAESPYGSPPRPQMPPPPPPRAPAPAGPPEYAGDQRPAGQPADPRRRPPSRPAAAGSDDAPEQAPEQPAPVAFRPPSRLAPPIPPDSPSSRGAGGGARPGGGAPEPTVRHHSDDDPFSSTSGRVPWAVTGGGSRAPAMPAPAGPPPISPPAWSPQVPSEASPSPAGAGSGRGGGAGSGGQGGPGGRSAAVRTEPGTVATAVSYGGYVLRVDSGEALELGPFCLLGREPVARDGDPPSPVLVRFDDVKLSVSKTHLAYGVDGRGFWVTDRNSTNGTTIIDSSGGRIACAPGAREYVPVGAQVQIGQRRLTVEGPDGDG